MLKKHAQLFQSFLVFSDIVIVILSWIAAYYLRFYAPIIPVEKGIPALGEFIRLLIFLIPIFMAVFKYTDLYEPMRASLRKKEFNKILQASLLATFIFVTAVYIFREYKYSRLVFLYFLVINVVSMSIFRFILRTILSALRRKGYNLRYVLILGDGRLAQDIAERILDHAESGLRIMGFLSRDEEKIGKEICGIKIIGSYKHIKNILSKSAVDQVVFALPLEEHRLMRTLLGHIQDEMVEIKIIPDLYQYFTLRKDLEELDGLPVISLRESPLYGWNTIIKRLFDIFVSISMIIFTGPLMIIIAILIKATSPGPLFYKQTRMGLDGKTFKLIKFRSMYVGAESKTGPVWAKKDDRRKTKIGTFIRRFNLDELPQFFNVLKGDMSVVGPRPERPVFMEEFKKKIPEYMLRHKMRSGITGWAQVNGLRGDTSIEERTKYDLYYIENWSLWFDIVILSKSFRAFKNAY